MREATNGGLRVAVVGSGISGLSAAYLLSRRHHVELFEKEGRFGGHAHTHAVVQDGHELHIDSGFLVYNHRTYPRFVRLLAELGVGGHPSDMSFSVRCRQCRLEYSTRGLNGLFTQRHRAMDPGYLRMLSDIPRFNRRARALLEDQEAPDRTLGEFLDEVSRMCVRVGASYLRLDPATALAGPLSAFLAARSGGRRVAIPWR